MGNATYQFTRPEIARYLRETFDTPGNVERGDVLRSLREQDAPQEMIDVVAALVPDGTRMTDMRVLWVYLRDVPLDREAA